MMCHCVAQPGGCSRILFPRTGLSRKESASGAVRFLFRPAETNGCTNRHHCAPEGCCGHHCRQRWQAFVIATNDPYFSNRGFGKRIATVRRCHTLFSNKWYFDRTLQRELSSRGVAPFGQPVWKAEQERLSMEIGPDGVGLRLHHAGRPADLRRCHRLPLSNYAFVINWGCARLRALSCGLRAERS